MFFGDLFLNGGGISSHYKYQSNHTKHIHKNHEFTVFSMFFLCYLPFSDESFNPSSNDVLSESTLECMRQQVMLQRYKVEAER